MQFTFNSSQNVGRIQTFPKTDSTCGFRYVDYLLLFIHVRYVGVFAMVLNI